MSAVADIFTGGKKAQRAANQASQQIQFDPMNIMGGALGSVHSGSNGVTLGPGAMESQFGGMLGQFGQGMLGMAGGGGGFGMGGMPLGLLDQLLSGINMPQTGGVPGATVGGLTAPGATAGMTFADLMGAGQGNLAASAGARDALGSFDPNAFAGQQFDRLQGLASRGEATQAQQMMENLQGRGRLGITQGGQQQELTELATAQEHARTGRALEALGLADREQQRLGQQAGMFGQLGAGQLGQAEGAMGALFGQQMAGTQFQHGQGMDLFSQLMQGNQMNFGQQAQVAQMMQDQGFGRFGSAMQALDFGQRQQGQDFGMGMGALQGLHGFMQDPLALLQLSMTGGMGNMEAASSRAGIQANAAQQRAAGNAGFFSGLLGAGADLATGWFGRTK